MAVLVDTNVFSYFLKDDTRNKLYKPHLKDQFLFLSFMTYAELYVWQLNRGWGLNLITKMNSALMRYSVQNSNPSICEIWAEIMFDSQKSGKPIDHPDAWIAATAIYLDVPLVSHNSKHFENIERLDLITENK